MIIPQTPSARLARAAAFRLTTAEILYRLPDHPSLLQTYVWQALDVPPRFPELRAFLRFWQEQIEGPLHSVRVAAADARGAARARHVDDVATLQ